mmetsp:Transcript_85894/g.237937  ORF Transcript_85894/g.237937 Transcript_85894/m.237937 type:complete len:227 (-) Transcript_85894:610-1290(-)
MRSRSSQLRDSRTSAQGLSPSGASRCSAKSASCNSSGSSTSALSAARALATASLHCQGSAVTHVALQVQPPEQACGRAPTPPSDATISAAAASLWLLPQPLVATETGDKSSQGAGGVGESSRLCRPSVSLGLRSEESSSIGHAARAAMESLMASALGIANRCCGSFSRSPKMAWQTSEAMSGGNSSGGSSHIRRTNASGLPASKGRRNAATSYRHTPSAQASAAGP